jgi:phage FluMu protein Com
MPISIGRQMVQQALEIVHDEDLVYYDFRCPKCKKSNRVSKEQLLHADPTWEYEPEGKEKGTEEE